METNDPAETPLEGAPHHGHSCGGGGHSCGGGAAFADSAVAENVPQDRPTAYVVSAQNRMGGKPADYYWNEIDLKVGDLCVAESDGVEFFGSVNVAKRPSSLLCAKKKPAGKILRAATAEDIKKADALAEKEKSAFNYCRERILDADLQMSLSAVHCSFDGLKAMFIFTADGRVDFRDLVKDLAGFTRMKVEMRQIGVRDEAKFLGGCGPCGKELCCTSFLPDFAPVSIRMAKDQNLSLNPTKIAGVCGRLMCCLSYEHENYKTLMEKAPKMGKQVVAPDGKIGRVVHINALREKVGLIFEDGSRMECGLTEVVPAHKRPGQSPVGGEEQPARPLEKPRPSVERERAPEPPRTPRPQRPEPAVAGEALDEDRKSSKKRPRRRKKRGGERPVIEGGPISGPAQAPAPADRPPARPAPEQRQRPIEQRPVEPENIDSGDSDTSDDQETSRHSRRQRRGMRRRQ